jgi:molecular chaperone DnaJ
MLLRLIVGVKVKKGVEMNKKDYYGILGVEKNSTESDIRTAYRKLALQYHPDRNPDNKEAEDKFKEIAEAYDILSNPDKKRNYDMFGHQSNNPFGNGMHNPFEDIFKEAFSGAFNGFGNNAFWSSNKRNNKKDSVRVGANIVVELNITLQEAYFGKVHILDVPGSKSCDVCNGTGITPGHNLERCRSCGGTGEIQSVQANVFMSRTCGACRGEGVQNLHPCNNCNGSGKLPRDRKFTVNIPKGVRHGMKLKIGGGGEELLTNNSVNGDLFIIILTENSFGGMERIEDDLIIHVYIDVITAMCGGELKVKTLIEELPIVIPPGTFSGAKFIINGKGFPIFNTDKFGDLIVDIKVSIPKIENKKIKKSLDRLLKEYIDER